MNYGSVLVIVLMYLFEEFCVVIFLVFVLNLGSVVLIFVGILFV